MDSKNNDFKGFYEVLCDTIENDEDHVYSDIVKYCPDFFKLLCDILENGKVDWHTKLIIDAALAYFVIPNDVISESEYGAMGYVDDVFICAYVLNEIKDKVSEDIILEHWDKEEDILKIIENVFSQSKKIVGDKYTTILEFVGLRKDKLPTIGIKSIGTSKRIEQLLFEKDELIGLLGYLSRVMYRMPPSRNKKQLINFLKNQQLKDEDMKSIFSGE